MSAYHVRRTMYRGTYGPYSCNSDTMPLSHIMGPRIAAEIPIEGSVGLELVTQSYSEAFEGVFFGLGVSWTTGRRSKTACLKL